MNPHLFAVLALPIAAVSSLAAQDIYHVQYLSGHVGLDHKQNGRLIIDDHTVAFADANGSVLFEVPLEEIRDASSQTDTRDVGGKGSDGLASARSRYYLEIVSDEDLLFKVEPDDAHAIAVRLRFATDRKSMTTLPPPDTTSVMAATASLVRLEYISGHSGMEDKQKGTLAVGPNAAAFFATDGTVRFSMPLQGITDLSSHTDVDQTPWPNRQEFVEIAYATSEHAETIVFKVKWGTSPAVLATLRHAIDRKRQSEVSPINETDDKP